MNLSWSQDYGEPIWKAGALLDHTMKATVLVP
jgi:hypothetical protein